MLDTFAQLIYRKHEKIYPVTQLLLRYSIGIGFLLAVIDRLGYFGASGEANVIWRDWTDFLAYTHQLMPYVSIKTASFLVFWLPS